MLSCFSHVQLFATLWTLACQAPLSMGFSRQEYWSGLPCPPLGDLSNSWIEPRSPTLFMDYLPAEPQGKPKNIGVGSPSPLCTLLGPLSHPGLLIILPQGFPDSSVGKESAYNAGDPGSIPGSGRSPGEGIRYPLQYSWAFLVALLVKHLPAMWETWVRSLG